MESNQRTSIFEGAFRAWSHLGSLSLEMLDTGTVQDLDPTNFVIVNENLIQYNGSSPSSPFPLNGIPSRSFAFEALPRSGLLHPFVKAILLMWLDGGERDRETLEKGLKQLRSWWQHRRQSACKMITRTLADSEQLRDTLDNYTRDFFELAHCQVMVDRIEAPRTLQKKLCDREKRRQRAQGSSSPEGTGTLVFVF